jgi:hypothetical protein
MSVASVGQETRMTEMRNEYGILVPQLEEKTTLETKA